MNLRKLTWESLDRLYQFWQPHFGLSVVIFAAVVSYWGASDGSPATLFREYLTFGATLAILFSVVTSLVVIDRETYKIFAPFFPAFACYFISFSLLIHFSYGAFAVSLFQLLWLRWKDPSLRQSGLKQLGWLTMNWALWHVMLRLHWAFPEDSFYFIRSRGDTFVVFLISLVAFHFFFFGNSWKLTSPNFLNETLFIKPIIKKELLLGALVLGVASLQTPRLEPFYNWVTCIHHWGVYLGVSELLKKGAELYSEVPSQYGFLQALSWAYLPFSSWQGLYGAQATCFLISSLLVFILANRVLKNVWVSLLLTYGTTFHIAGWTFDACGPYSYPSSGALRFLWAYLLIGGFWLQEESLKQKVFLSVCWVLGSFWSSESFLFCTLIFWPAYFLMALKDRKYFSLSIPIGLFILTMTSIEVLWRSIYGQGVRWEGFFEYAHAFTAGFSKEPSNPHGAIWLPILLLGMILSLAHHELIKNQVSTRLVVLAGAVFGLTSYYFGRGHDNNLLNLSPLYFLISLLFWEELKRAQMNPLLKLYPFYLISFFTVLMTLSFGNIFANRDNLFHLFHPKKVTSLVRVAQGELLELYRKGNLKQDAPLVSDGHELAPLLPESDTQFWEPWIPAYPTDLFRPLSSKERCRYLLAYFKKKQSSGWFLHLKNQGPDETQFYEEMKALLKSSHEIIKEIESPSYLLQWYEWRQLPICLDDRSTESQKNSNP